MITAAESVCGARRGRTTVDAQVREGSSPSMRIANRLGTLG